MIFVDVLPRTRTLPRTTANLDHLLVLLDLEARPSYPGDLLLRLAALLCALMLSIVVEIVEIVEIVVVVVSFCAFL